MKIVISIVGIIALFFLTPILIVSFVKAPLGLEIKVMLFTGFLLAILIAGLLFEVASKLTSIQLFARVNFIANETTRLDADNKIPSMQILKSDMDEEQEMEKFTGELISGMSTAKQWLIVIVLQGVLIYGMYYFWPQA